MSGDQFAKWLVSPQAGALFSGLLSASGPSTTPISMGQGMAMGMQNMQAAEEQELKKRMMDMQLRKMGLEEKQYASQLEQEQRRQAALDKIRYGRSSSDYLQGANPGGTAAELERVQSGNIAPLSLEQAGMLSQQQTQGNPTNSATAGMLSAQQQDLIDYYYDSGQPEKAFEIQGLFNKPKEAPSGYKWANPQDPNSALTPVPGGPADKVTDPGRLMLAKIAENNLPTIKSLIYDKKEDGSIDTDNPNRWHLYGANLPLVPWAKTLPMSDGRRLDSLMRTGLSAAVYYSTGATATPEEIANMMSMMKPGYGDDAETIRAKLKTYEDFLRGTIQLVDPSGRFDSGYYQEQLQQRANKPVEPKYRDTKSLEQREKELTGG